MNLKERLEAEKVKVDDNFYDLVQKYKSHLLKWNKTHNLTGAKDEQTLDDFIFDAVYPVKFLPKCDALLDIGTGAGFPGMILAMALKDTKVTLAEPLTKRASFLQFIKADLGLENVKVVKKRVEDMDAQIFDVVTSRAVTDTQMLLKLSENFRDEHSVILFYKGENVYNEIPKNMKHEVIQTDNRHYLLLKA
ncbi:16S rRNA (guanine(527)-N(7))-methyltransferase RsmG [Sulfurimonas lithotrophica]|uniref:Ribosomal RNA small subunit methyltransferase G n=1 Tax=Sulfurimonas lithotrophica TaxID=2590022 RepID=A0A5P8P2X5_9BACT|nr:16S rRNA (guanine(527)-N(7))-methyltransferase RsmG [Sulfurimonas lithotrophica]QFR49920.1 16S rRNA (guanine(527)-N(7))-methyltransferase RsmG [Sulfurimonas lithotrophica]